MPEWDEKGNPIPSGTEWDEHGNVVTVPAQAQQTGQGSLVGDIMQGGPLSAYWNVTKGYGSTLADLYKGAAKGLANSVIGAGEITNRVGSALGINDANPQAFEAARAQVAPSNPVQEVGKGAEQAAEFIALPGPSKVKGLARAVELGKAGLEAAGLSKVQGASNTGAAAAGVLTAAPIAEAGAAGMKWLGDRAIRSVLKPTISAMKRVAGNEGAEAKAAQMVDFIARNQLTTPEKAQAIISRSEQELQRALTLNNAPTDAPGRIQRYLDALKKNAAKQALPESSVNAIQAKMEEILRGPMGQDALAMAPDGSLLPTRELRPSVPAKEALESARQSSRLQTAGTWGPQTTAENASQMATKAVERAQRDAVKAAVPEAAPLLRTQSQAITARDALDRAAFREGNHNVTGGIAGAVEMGAKGSLPVVGFAAGLLRSGELRAGVYAGSLARAIQEGNGPQVAFILQKLGVSVAPQLLRPAVAGS